MEEIQPTVKVQDGRLRGKIKVDWQGRIYYSFQGIPYAKPPIGHLRFKAPQPAEPWIGVRDATVEGDACFARDYFKMISGSEDCLFLNVYTSELPTEHSQLKPVMVWIHGGGFTAGSGSSSMYGPDFLVSEDVIVVTINYRLGLLGFASFEDPSLEIPGNAGLKDQVLALKWIQRNIRTFCGDPNNVTVFGESAGGASAHYLMLSPVATGLFHRVIAQSGVCISPWARGVRSIHLISDALHLSTDNEAEVVNILKDMSVEELFKVQEKVPERFVVYEQRHFGPVVEPYANEETFLSEEPLDIMKSGRFNKVPLMIGYTAKEGILLLIYYKLKLGKMNWTIDFEDTIPYDLEMRRGSKSSTTVASRIEEFYFGGEVPSKENSNQYYSLHTDVYFLLGINNVVRYHIASSSSPVFYYRMSVDTKLNIFKRFSHINEEGTCHGDDIGYLFKSLICPDIQPNSSEDIALRRCIKLWTTFAKYGDPNPIQEDPLITITWPPAQKHQLNYLDIGENLTVGVSPDSERIQFWDEIYSLRAVKSAL